VRFLRHVCGVTTKGIRERERERERARTGWDSRGRLEEIAEGARAEVAGMGGGGSLATRSCPSTLNFAVAGSCCIALCFLCFTVIVLRPLNFLRFVSSTQCSQVCRFIVVVITKVK
jgi:hypothetical protein